MQKIKFIDMFGGIGGFRKGLEEASDKFKCVWYNDIDKYAVSVYNHNFGGNYNAKDIKKVKATDIPDFDLLCAGFPCQAFSIAGKRRGFKDTRGTLFFEIARIIRAKKPKYILLENVKGLLNHEKGETFSTIIQTLAELGYECQWMVFNSKFFGVPQNRERVFIVGNLAGESRPEILPFRENDKKIAGEVPAKGIQQTAQCMTARQYTSWNGNFLEDGTIKCLTAGAHSGGLHDSMTWLHQQDRVYDSDGISPTLQTSAGGRHIPMIAEKMNYIKLGKVYDNGDVAQANRVYLKNGIITSIRGNTRTKVYDKAIRRLTPIECERLQGFPDNWTKYGYSPEKAKHDKKGFYTKESIWNFKLLRRFKRKVRHNKPLVEISDTQRYKMLGNAVTVNVIKAIGERLCKTG